jgi:tRNA-splicing ligase RtcB
MMDKLKTLIPLEDLEASAREQIYEALDLPFLKKLVIMPDCHTGYTLPIGGVALLDNVISAAYVGYDIGCGMCTYISNSPVECITGGFKRGEILQKLYEKIPVGFNSGKKMHHDKFKSASGDKKLNDKVNGRLRIQLGTLGGGNHFIEIGEDREGMVAVTIHSGSRNPGHSVASHYMKLGTIGLPLGFFQLDSDLGQAYLADMDFMLSYALMNRLFLLAHTNDVLSEYGVVIDGASVDYVNENHNHAEITPDGVLHRKGATPAETDKLGIIPGNMRDGVYVTVGLGNEEYLRSSSHGAGRTMSRKRAKKELDLDEFRESMKGITAKLDKGLLDEAPGAYKDIHYVIEKQEGIVMETINYIKPLINIKG